MKGREYRHEQYQCDVSGLRHQRRLHQDLITQGKGYCAMPNPIRCNASASDEKATAHHASLFIEVDRGMMRRSPNQLF